MLLRLLLPPRCLLRYHRIGRYLVPLMLHDGRCLQSCGVVVVPLGPSVLLYPYILLLTRHLHSCFGCLEAIITPRIVVAIGVYLRVHAHRRLRWMRGDPAQFRAKGLAEHGGLGFQLDGRLGGADERLLAELVVGYLQRVQLLRMRAVELLSHCVGVLYNII